MTVASSIEVYEDRASLSRAAARLFAAEALRAVESRGRFTVLLSGGETPLPAYELLAVPPLRESIPWAKVHIFWGDERYVAPDDPRSNARMACRAFLDHVPVPPEQIHPIPYCPTPQESAVAYEKLLRSFFAGEESGFDLVFLGLGTDGHTASLFSGTAAVAERERWVTEVYVAEQELYRVTLTAPVINRGALVVFVVAGGDKAAIVRVVLEENPDPHRIPARLIGPVPGRLLWMLDRQSARLLTAETVNPGGNSAG
jgi:6-phosphogluconolactonase